MARLVSRALVLLAGSAMSAGAQEVRVSGGQPNWSANGTTVTAPFLLANQRASTLRTVQRIDLPRDWHLVTGNAPMVIEPSGTSLLMLSAVVPVKTLAGTYGIRVAVFDAVTERFLGSDSIRIVVEPRRSVDVVATEHPGFTISGRGYDAVFSVRNRGNVRASVSIKAKSTLGSARAADDTARLSPGETRIVRVHVSNPSTEGMSSDDVVELVVAQANVKEPARASARVTVVPPASTSIDDYQRLPTQVSLRAANGTGVSPYVVTGSGQLRVNGAERLDFTMKGRAGAMSMFGERDEYRFDLRAPTWRIRGGDHLYSVSPMTSGGQEGMGVGAEKRFGLVGAGGYAEQFRRTPGNAREAGAYVSAYPIEGVRFSGNLVDRVDGPLAGKIGSVSANLDRGGVTFEAELARSADSASSGMGRLVRLSGQRGTFNFDVGHSKGDSLFLGPQRAAEHDYLFASGQAGPLLAFNVSASTHSASESYLIGLPSHDRLSFGTVGLTIASLLNVEAAGAAHERRFGATTTETQGSLRARFMPAYGYVNATVAGEVGRASPVAAPERQFSDLSLSFGVSVPRGSVSTFVEQYSGGSIIKGLDDMLTLGGSVAFRALGLDANVVVSANRLGGVPSYWLTNIDGVVAHTLRNGASITMRARAMEGGFGLASPMPPVAYLEYTVPVGLPVGRLRTPGRANGRVIDAATGRGVANALVRLGPQVAITDKNGRVAFGGLPAGEHRVSLSQEMSYADAVFIGDPVLRMDTVPGAPKQFTLKVARGARVDLTARLFAVSRTGIAGSPDSLVDVGPLAGTAFRLVGERDTVYRSTDDAGHVTFSDIVPGHWVLEPDDDTPSFHRFDPERIELELAGGEARSVTIQLVPKRREIKLMNPGEEVEAIPAQPPAPASAAPKTARPQTPPRPQR